ncbi:MAG: tetratricopeptide repeat protein [Nitrospirae bacterium]|nr:tetratricopeptide repeat protein [Nitrospirota bacterium]
MREDKTITNTARISSAFLYQNNLIFHLLLIAVVGLIAYSNTFNVPFVFDDEPNIVDNPSIKHLDNFISSSKGYEYNPRRFIGYLTFALNYHFGMLDVTGYHIVNLAIHIINAILVYFFVRLTFNTPFFSSQLSAISSHNPPSSPLNLRGDRGGLQFIPLFSALFFVAHPIQTQAVTYIVQRVTSLATMFYLFSMVLYVKGRLAGQKQVEVEVKRNSTLALTLIFYFLSLLSAVLAMMTKEIAFTLPIIIVLYEFTFFKSTLKKKLLVLMPFLLTIIIIPLSMIGTDKPLGDIISDLSEQARETQDISRWDYLMTEMRVITTYIRLIFLPINQNLDYDYPIYHSLFTPSVLISFLFLLSILCLAVYLLCKSQFKVSSSNYPNSKLETRNSKLSSRLLSFGIFLFFITLSVESSIIPIRDVIFEQRVYLPSVGAFVAIATSIFIMIEKLKSKWQKAEKIFIPLFALIIIALSGAAYARNTVWQNELTLWEDVILKSPQKARGHNNLGVVYKEKGLIDEAIKQYQIALTLNPDYAEAHNNFGNAFDKKGFSDQAIEQYQIALTLNPDYADAHSNLGVVYRKKGLIVEAIEQYQIAIRLKPEFAEAHNNIGIVYADLGLTDKAIEQYQIALTLNPDYAEAHNNIGIVYRKKGWIDKAINQYQITLALNPDDAEAHNNLGNIYADLGLTDKAIEHLQMATRLNPAEPIIRNNLTKVYEIKKTKQSKTGQETNR